MQIKSIGRKNPAREFFRTGVGFCCCSLIILLGCVATAFCQQPAGTQSSMFDADSVSYSITLTSGQGGKIVNVDSERPSINIAQRAGSPDAAASSVFTARSGRSVFFAVVPSEGWDIESMQVDGKPYIEKRNPQLMISQYRWPIVTVPALAANHTVRVMFKKPGLVITASAGVHGAIVPAGAVTVTRGAVQEFSMTPDSGYAVVSLMIDGKVVGPVQKYTFTNVMYDHTIEVTFGQ